MNINHYINFKGNCREAVEFYAKVFGTEKPQFMEYGDAPADPSYVLPEENRKLIMHVLLKINGNNIMFSDTTDDMPFVVGNNMSLVLTSNDVDEVQVLFNKLKEDGTVTMELQETFWSKCFGQLTDKYGIIWLVGQDSGEMGL